MNASRCPEGGRLSLRCGVGTLLAALLVLLNAGSRARAAAISFLPPVSYPMTGASGITAVDLDGDGNLDLLVGDISSGRLSLLYGRGDGTFEAPVEMQLGKGYEPALSVDHQIVAADVNGDGLLDLIVPQNALGKLLVFINRGHRSFADPVAYPMGTQPLSVAAADFNGDGKIDLAVTNHLSNNMCVLLNRGDGTFFPPVFYPAGTNPGGISAADLNGDGNIDLALANIVGNTVSVYLGDGTGKFVPAGSYPVGAAPAHVIIDDFNGDGKPDLAIPNWFGNSVGILLGDGTGKFSPAVYYSAGGYAGVMGVADLDGDGAPDLVCAVGGTTDVAVLRNRGDGSFALPAAIFAGGDNTRTLAVGDFNNDGRPDIAAGNQSSFTVSILINDTPRPSPAIRDLVIDPSSVIGGCESTTGAVTLTAPAPSDGATVSLTSTNPAVLVPESVKIPAGATRVSFTPTLSPVTVTTFGTVTASYQGSGKRRAVTVRPGGVAGLRLTPASVIGGQPVDGEVSFACPAGAGGLTVTLANSAPGLVTVPEAVTAAPGAAGVTFALATKPVGDTARVVITAMFAGVTRTATLELRPAPPPPPLAINLLVNGSFEEPDVSGSPYFYGYAYGPDPQPGYPSYRGPSIPGWRITRGTIDVVKVHWPAIDGQQSIDLVGSPGAATIEQSFATEPGREYLFSGYVSHNPDTPFGRADVFLDRVFFTQLVHLRPAQPGPYWAHFVYRFRAAAATTTLTISDTHSDNPVRGTALDGLAVTPAVVPIIPSPYALPGVPGGLLARAAGPGQIEISWSDNSLNETGFTLYRQAGAGQVVGIAVVGADVTRFVDQNVLPGITYQYWVGSQNDYGSAGNAGPVTITLDPMTGQPGPPAAPTGLTATPAFAGLVSLTWAAGIPGATGIGVWRRTAASDWARIADVDPSATAFSDRGVQPNTAYTYRIRAHTNTLVSAWTSEVTVRTLP